MLSKRELIRDYLKILIIMFFGCIIGVLSVYMYEARLYPIVQIIELINPPTAPSDYINESQIQIFDDKFCVEVPNTHLTSYTATNSMLSTLDDKSNGIEIPANQTQINVGDIVAYRSSDKNETHLIAHRIIEIKNDSQNKTIYLLKGDNNGFMADGWINESQIVWKTISIIY